MAGRVQPKEETVEALLETVRELLRAEDSRAQGLNARGTGLVAFAGLAVSVSATLGVRAVDVQIALAWRIVAGSSLFLGVLTLLAGIGVLAYRVLMPRAYSTIAMSEIRRYASLEMVAQDRVMVQGRTMAGLIEALATERRHNDERATALKGSYAFLVGGLILISVVTGILILAGVGVL